jgi:hypothetical protein
VRAVNSAGSTATDIRSFSTPAAIRSASFSPPSLSFGQVAVGRSQTLWVQLINNGNIGVPVASVTLTGEAFSTTLGSTVGANWNECPPGVYSYCGFSVTFSPTSPGPYSGSIVIHDADKTYTLPLSGEGQIAPVISIATVNNPSYDQMVWVGQPLSRVIPIANVGLAPLIISNVTLGEFKDSSYLLGDCAGGIPSGGSCTLTVLFTPTITPFQNGLLFIYYNGPESPHVASFYEYTRDIVLTPVRPSRTGRPTPRSETETTTQTVESSGAQIVRDQRNAVRIGKVSPWLFSFHLPVLDDEDTRSDKNEPGTVLLDANAGVQGQKGAIKTSASTE